MGTMIPLDAITAYCDQRLRIGQIQDFPGAVNGLQVGNRGQISRVGAAVDAGLEPFREALRRGIDLLIVHHGLFWEGSTPWTGPVLEKMRLLVEGNLAVYSAHLPLDCHPEIGNNALLGRLLGLEPAGTFLPYEGNDIGWIGHFGQPRETLWERLCAHFGREGLALTFGPENPQKVAILTGSGSSAVPHLRPAGIDTLVTGELKQHAFNQAQELGLNLYSFGHYATETFGVRALAEEVSSKFALEAEFIDTACPL